MLDELMRKFHSKEAQGNFLTRLIPAVEVVPLASPPLLPLLKSSLFPKERKFIACMNLIQYFTNSRTSLAPEDNLFIDANCTCSPVVRCKCNLTQLPSQWRLSGLPFGIRALESWSHVSDCRLETLSVESGGRGKCCCV